jgi:hypothetical protein
VGFGKLHIGVKFPYGSHKKSGADFDAELLHQTKASLHKKHDFVLEHHLDGTRYTVQIRGNDNAYMNGCLNTVNVHGGSASDAIELAIRFTPDVIPVLDALPEPPPKRLQSFDTARAACVAFWEKYWTTGGAIDFSGSTDSRAGELERRIVLSQYLIAIQSRGSLPPAETGHTCNSWYGKFHLEMHYWHTAHFALWGRVGELKKSLAYYKKILPVARKIAASQGYAGARWPKMCDPTGSNTPSSVAVLLLWQQPHPIMLAELCYRAYPRKDFLREYRDIIVESAEFMCSFAHFEPQTDGAGCGRYVLGAPYIPAQERHDPRAVLNAAYEVEYFRWGLRQANIWLERLGEPPRADFAEVAEKLAVPTIKDGLYLAHENCPGTFTTLPFYTDHPSMLAMYGILNSEKIDRAVMSATLDKVLEVWDKTTFYGWDFPMMAMTACRLGRREDAVRLLLLDSPKNTYLPNGHNRMEGDAALPLYLPGNAGLLLAVAMMSAGYDDTGSIADTAAPGFPEGWTVRTEGLKKYI